LEERGVKSNNTSGEDRSVNIQLGILHFLPVMERLDLAGAMVASAIRSHAELAEYISVAEIDPQLSDTAGFCERYQVSPELAANCVIVEARRGEEKQFAACVVLATTRADVNGIVRKTLDARRASFARMEEAVAQSQMEFGAITPIGLPNNWAILVDSAVAASDYVIIGSGIRKSKLAVPGTLFSKLPGATILEGLGRKPVHA
jgi:prolyl-tRNA editing enzyme YbaK/EbsC (Cys-tRNA(Pro) deacylase)